MLSFSYLLILSLPFLFIFFFFNDTATTEIYTLSLHDALPISLHSAHPLLARKIISPGKLFPPKERLPGIFLFFLRDRKSTRLNSSHTVISYAVFCLKKKKKTNTEDM